MTLKQVMRESPLVWHLNQYLLTGVARSVGQENQGLLVKTDYPRLSLTIHYAFPF
jgi:hypothetical protein